MAELWDVLNENRNKTGRLHERGKPMQKGDYHLIVHVWIINAEGKFLISRRTPGESRWAGMWQTTGGCAVSCENSLSAALRETKEELGIALNPENGRLFKQYAEPHINDDGCAFFDIWVFRQEPDVSELVFQPEETCGAMWADNVQLKQMISVGVFIPPSEAYPYLDELFTFYGV